MNELQSALHWEDTLLQEDALVADAVKVLDKTGLQIVLIVNENGVLQGTITDGDIRRGFMSGVTLQESVKKVLNRNFHFSTSQFTELEVVNQMHQYRIDQIPILDETKKVVGILIWNRFIDFHTKRNLFVIMAGGKGTRLKPFTENCPKPMLVIAGKPILLHILERARSEGFRNFVFTTHHLAQIIEDYFEDGSKFGVSIQYIREEVPLGTAGSLGLLSTKLPIVVSNGDVITEISYANLLSFHEVNSAQATMSVRFQEWQNPFGVVETDGIDIVGYEEKPITYSLTNAGVYVLSSSQLRHIPTDTYIDMPSFIESIRQKRGRVIAYPLHENWIDIGRPDDFLRAKNRLTSD